MTWTIETDTENELIVVSVCEEISVDEDLYLEVADKVIIYNRTLKFNILFIVLGPRMDLSENEIVNLVHRTCYKYKEEGMEEVKVAGVVSRSNHAGWKFVVLINRMLGRHASLFLTEEKAIEWLVDPHEF
ncbi:MAG: hypothetical protein GQ468_05325 [Candidatus Scalindua sp.]|nr:hypothetical protein [Candidatus Scalindua sp.]